MTGDEGNSRGGSSATLPAGALSALLRDLAAAPPAAAGGGGAPVSGEWDPGLHAGSVVVGRFELVRELGRGGFGVVWEAHDRQLGRRVAFKAVRPGSLRDLREERLLREAEAAARLTHPNIVTLHDAGRSESGPYLVLELLEGETLAGRLAHGALPVPEALRIAVEVAKGLAHAHAHGVVHRDLKPDNVFLCDDGRVKVLDFGLAHAFGHQRADGGTPAYMAPEQAEGSPEDERTDVWALGAILFEMLSGARASSGSTPFTSAPCLEVPGAPAIGALVAKMLAPQPRDRPRDAGDVLPALSSFAADLGRSPPAEHPVKVRRRISRRALAMPGAALVVVAVGATVLPCAWGAAWKPCTYVRDPRIRPPAAVPAHDARIRVLVTDIANDTGERELDVLSRLLVTSLEQSRRLVVMTQDRVLDLAQQRGMKDVSRVDERVGRQVGQEHGVRVVLVPAVHRVAATYALEVRAIDPSRDEHLFTLRERASSRDALLDVVDRLSERAREELRESAAEVETARIRIAEAMTANLEAYQHYVAGLEAWHRDGLRAAALREYREAVRLDPHFAAAHAKLAALYFFYGRPDLAAPHAQASVEHVERMPEKERMLLVLVRRQPWWQRLRAGQPAGPDLFTREEALRFADEVTARFPGDKLVLATAAFAYRRLGAVDRAEAAAREALNLDPGFFYAAVFLQNYLNSEAHRPSVDVARRAVATRPTAANVALLALALWGVGGADRESVTTARDALRIDGGQSSLVTLNACRVLFWAGADDDCAPVWERMAAYGSNELERDYARNRLIESLAVRGRVREARRLLASTDEAKRGDPADVALVLSVGRAGLEASGTPEPALGRSQVNVEDESRMFRIAGVRRTILAMLGGLKEAVRVPRTLPYRGADAADLYEAVARLEQGRPAEALERVRSFERSLEDVHQNFGLFAAALVRGEALLATGRTEEAASTEPVQIFCRCVLPLDRAVFYPQLALLRASAMERLGRRADAIHELDGVIAFWKDADPDLPLLVEAKAMRKRFAVPLPFKKVSAPAR